MWVLGSRREFPESCDSRGLGEIWYSNSMFVIHNLTLVKIQ